MVDESNEQFVAYFLPTPDTIEKREDDKRLGIPFGDDQEYVPMHTLVHEYTHCTYISMEGKLLAVYFRNGYSTFTVNHQLTFLVLWQCLSGA